MNFPYEFKQSQGILDHAAIYNYAANTAVGVVGGISVGVIANVSLKALGFGDVVVGVATAIPVAATAIGLAGSIWLGYALTHMFRT